MAQRLLMKGNEAVAEAAIRAGCRHFYGYPITPQTEVAAYMSKRMPKVGGLFLQAESEIGAINMVMGSAAAGKRTMTSSSSPGISLKTEGISFLAGSDLPAVILNIQRAGPGLGGIQPSQADYNQAVKAAGHGDFKMLVFTPATVQEMCDCVFTVFDLTDKYRMPGMLLCDGLLGQMMEPVVFPEPVEGLPAKPWAVNGHRNARPGNLVNSLYLHPEALEARVRERFEMYKTIEETETQAECFMTEDAEIVVVAYGACARIARSAVTAAREAGIKAGLFRPITVWPYPKRELTGAAKTAKAVLTVEMSMGQMVEDVRAALEYKKPVEFFGRTGGVVPTPAGVLGEITRMAKGEWL
ncbi:MAG: 3-methyl-2-oxobutanoate dehydrogenase subunit VorB [Oscillospiraceae bacterium]|nr:3-methyl-2-oxobutanoate dehydrogenase subunit VorB [Oscillospiraceae bacterium]